MHVHELKNKRVLIVGYGVTGASVARFLRARQVEFDIADDCDLDKAHSLAADFACHVHPGFDAGILCEYNVLVLSPGVARSSAPVRAALDAGLAVIGDIELFADAAQPPVIAVTGSNGKSSVVTWVAQVLNSAGIQALACGNIGCPALDSLLLPADVYVLELSSYQLESTSSLRPLVATVLNVSDDHLDRYDDIEHYAAVKRTIYRGARLCVANRDDARTWPEPGNAHGDFFTLHNGRSSRARWHRDEKHGERYLCDDGYAMLKQAELSVPGDHNAANALAVLALIDALSIPFTAVKDALLAFSGLPHRTEFLQQREGVRWYNDSKGTNVDACIKAVLAMPGPVLLIAGGISKDADFQPLRPVLERHARLLVLIGRDRKRMAEQLDGSTEIVFAESLREAVLICRQCAVEGDAVLLSPACSSFDMFSNFEERGQRFTEMVEEVLAA